MYYGHYRFPKPHVCIWIMLLHFARLDGLDSFGSFPWSPNNILHTMHIYIYRYKIYIYIRISQSDLVPRAISDFDLGTKMKAYNTLQTIHPKTDEPDASRCPMKPVNALSRPCRKTGHQTHRFTRLFGAIYCQSFHHQY